MNKTLRRALLVGGAWLGTLLLAACATPSVHPIYGKADTPASEPGLVGTWKAPDSATTYAITRVGDGYHMLVKNNDAKDAKQWEFAVRLVKIGEYNFADIAAVEEERDSHEEHWGTFFLPTHMFARWSLQKDSLCVNWLNRKWLEKGLADKTVKIGTTTLDPHTILITAQTADLQDFLQKHGGDAAAFADGVILERQKP